MITIIGLWSKNIQKLTLNGISQPRHHFLMWKTGFSWSDITETSNVVVTKLQIFNLHDLCKWPTKYGSNCTWDVWERISYFLILFVSQVCLAFTSKNQSFQYLKIPSDKTFVQAYWQVTILDKKHICMSK